MPLMMSVRQKNPSAITVTLLTLLPLACRDAPGPAQRHQAQYLASIETAYGTFLADTRPEEKAEQLRNAEPNGPRSSFLRCGFASSASQWRLAASKRRFKPEESDILRYPENLIAIMRQDLTEFGVRETRSADDVDDVLARTQGPC